MRLLDEITAINPEYYEECRPWGKFIRFSLNNPCTPKILCVNKGQALSLQYHEHRDQHYVILDDGFLVTFSTEPVPARYGNDLSYVRSWWPFCKRVVRPKPGEQFYFAKRVVHRVEYNGEREAGRIFEIAYGMNDEEDITRLEDRYGRDG